MLSSVRARVADLPLRPLLFAVGAAATSVSIYGYIKRGDGKKSTADRENKTVCEQDTEPALVQPADVVQDHMKVSDAEEKHQNAVEIIGQLKEDKSELTNQVMALSDMVQDMRKQLVETHLECEDLRNYCKREQEAYSILQEDYDELKNTQYAELQKVSLTEAGVKHQKVGEIIAQLEMEKCDLTKEIETLSRAVQDMVKEVLESNNVCDVLTDVREKHLAERKQEARSILQVSVSDAEEKPHKAAEIIGQLEVEKSELLKQVNILRDTVQDMGEQLIETNLECDELMNKQEREREAYGIFQEEYEELKKTLIHMEELQKVSVCEAEQKQQKAEDTIAQLEEEKSDLTKQLETHSGTVQDMGTDRVCDNLMDERECEACSVQQAEYDNMKNTLTHREELLQISLAEAEEEHQKDVETIGQLEEERTALINQVETLRETVEDIRDLLYESHKQCEQLTEECERVREAHSRLQAENRELNKTLIHTEILKVSLSEAEEKHQKSIETIAQLEEENSHLVKRNTVGLVEAEEKHQNAIEIIAQLEEEKSDLNKQLETLRVTVQDMGRDLFEANRECDNLTDEREREQEAHRILQSEHEMMKEKLKRCEELLEEQVQKAEEIEQKAVQSTDKLDIEKSGLKSQMRDTLRGTVKDIKNMLYKPHKDKSEASSEST